MRGRWGSQPDVNKMRQPAEHKEQSSRSREPERTATGATRAPTPPPSSPPPSHFASQCMQYSASTGQQASGLAIAAGTARSARSEARGTLGMAAAPFHLLWGTPWSDKGGLKPLDFGSSPDQVSMGDSNRRGVLAALCHGERASWRSSARTFRMSDSLRSAPSTTATNFICVLLT